MCSKFVTRVPKNGLQSSYYYLLVNLEPTNNALQIKIFDQEQSLAWSGELKHEDAAVYIKALDINLESYWTILTKSLSPSLSNQNDFEYWVENGNKFLWKKISTDKKIKFKYGEISLTEISAAEISNKIFDELYFENLSLKDIKEEKENIIEVLQKDINSFRAKLDELTTAKLEMEETLYGKFLALLNSKKDKICELQNLLAAKAGPSSTLPAQSPGKRVHISESEESDPNDKDTDIEMEDENISQQQEDLKDKPKEKKISRLDDSLDDYFSV